ncbi:hypothetical protein ACH50_17260 [Franconibacter pulveris]|uniref:Uncharacterized protein n=1 Tax=Franconibacter pulveris TaxID=435910 RepID=A0A0J8VJN9_9ENTR|nr:hypothetical protein ACH50_17260 [Franconibacter pulveris]
MHFNFIDVFGFKYSCIFILHMTAGDLATNVRLRWTHLPIFSALTRLFRTEQKHAAGYFSFELPMLQDRGSQEIFDSCILGGVQIKNAQ